MGNTAFVDERHVLCIIVIDLAQLTFCVQKPDSQTTGSKFVQAMTNIIFIIPPQHLMPESRICPECNALELRDPMQRYSMRKPHLHHLDNARQCI